MRTHDAWAGALSEIEADFFRVGDELDLDFARPSTEPSIDPEPQPEDDDDWEWMIAVARARAKTAS